MTKLTRKQFIELASKEKMKVDELIHYVVIKVNSENIKMTDSFKKQLIEEGKYDNTYIGLLTPETSKPYSMDYLPIYGSTEKFITKHFVNSIDEAIMVDLKDRGLRLLKRYNEYNE